MAANIAMLVSVVIFLGATSVKPTLGHTWLDAHATFYGDMTGGETMRKFQ